MVNAHKSPASGNQSMPALLAAAAILGVLVAATAATSEQARAQAQARAQPDIVFCLVDDLGHDDTEVFGNAQVRTPHIRAMAQAGVVLTQYYAMPVCTPTRSAIITGRHPIHTGLQHNALLGQQKLGLPLEFRTLPQMLTEAGYATAAVGKWHLGFHTAAHLPTARGFDHFYGFLTGKICYFDHTDNEYNCGAGHPLTNGSNSSGSPLPAEPFPCAAAQNQPNASLDFHGLDLYDSLELDRGAQGVYSTELWTAKAIEAMERTRPLGKPLFLYFAPNAAHNGNWADPLQAPDRYTAPFRASIPCDGLLGNALVTCTDRRTLAGMLLAVDQGIANLSKAAARLGMDNVLWVVTSDNGGPSDDQQGDSFPPKSIDRNVASNWPLRGKKATVWEGGTRVLALLSGAGIRPTTGASSLLFHAADFAPTLLAAAAAESVWARQPGLGDGDGVNQWPALSAGGASPGPRTEVLHNIDPVSGSAALRVGRWKILRGAIEASSGGWYTGVTGLRRQSPAVAGATIRCGAGGVGETTAACNAAAGWCLFDLDDDPCEKRNLAAAEPAVLARLEQYNQTAVPALNDPRWNPDARWFPASWPALHGGAWVPWAADDA